MKKPESFTEEQLILIQRVIKNIIATGINAAGEARQDRITESIRQIEYEIKEELEEMEYEEKWEN